MPSIADATNVDEILWQVGHAETCVNDVCGEWPGDQIADLVEKAVQDFWFELPHATPGMLPEEIEGHATDGYYHVFVTGSPEAGGMHYNVEILELLA